MNASEYLEKHETWILNLVKEIGINKLKIAGAKGVTDYFRLALRALSMGIEKSEILSEEKVKNLRDTTNSDFDRNFSFDTNDLNSLAGELIELEKDWKTLGQVNEERKTQLNAFLQENPLPDGIPQYLTESIEITFSK